MQEGLVAPGLGGRVLQLTAYSNVVVNIPNGPYAGNGYSSVGYEVVPG